MSGANAVFLLIIALVVVYLGVSGKGSCFTLFLKCVSGNGASGDVAQGGTATPDISDLIPKVTIPSVGLPKLPSIKKPGDKAVDFGKVPSISK